MEDHDDLMPVFAAQSDLLSATYGEFFLADMIELQDSSNKASHCLRRRSFPGSICVSAARSSCDTRLKFSYHVSDVLCGVGQLEGSSWVVIRPADRVRS